MRIKITKFITAIALVALIFTSAPLPPSTAFAEEIDVTEYPELSDEIFMEDQTLSLPAEIKVRKGKYAQLNIESEVYGKITYSSANKKIATVSSSGKIKGIRLGATTITVTAAGDEYHAPASATIRVIVPRVITKATLAKTKFGYNGEAQYPQIKTINGSAKLIEGVDYEVLWPDNPKERGTYSVLIKGIGRYDGTVKKSYTIVKGTPAITVDPVIVKMGETAKLNLTYPEECAITTTLKNTEVAAFDPETLDITGLAPGNTTITVNSPATDNYVKASKSISVKILPRVFKADTRFTAHRGYSGVAPENTMPAFQLAGEAGFHAIEFDIWESKTSDSDEPYFVIMHDATLDRMCGTKGFKSWNVNADNRENFPIISGSNVSYYNTIYIPDYYEALDCIYSAGAIPTIELKSKTGYKMSDTAMRAVIDSIGDRDARIISFDLNYLKRLEAMNPPDNIKVGLCMNKTKSYKTYFNACQANGIDYIDMKMTILSTKIINEAKARGLDMNTWALPNDPAFVLTYKNMGVSGVTSNYKLFED